MTSTWPIKLLQTTCRNPNCDVPGGRPMKVLWDTWTDPRKTLVQARSWCEHCDCDNEPREQ